MPIQMASCVSRAAAKDRLDFINEYIQADSWPQEDWPFCLGDFPWLMWLAEKGLETMKGGNDGHTAEA